MSSQIQSYRSIKMGLIVLVSGAFALIAWSLFKSEQAELHEWRGHTMGTTYTIKAYGNSLEKGEHDLVKEEVDLLLESLNDQMSTYRKDSEISRFNRSDSVEPFSVSPEFAFVANLALDVSERTGGAFDFSLDPLINLWGFGDQGIMDTYPTGEDISHLLGLMGAGKLEVLSETAIRKKSPELQLNLNAIAKGYAVDAVSELLYQCGITNSFVEIGGEIRTSGLKENGLPWRVGIESPLSEQWSSEEIEGVVDMENKAIATSGNYRNFFVDEEGRLISHILDPRTGYPVEHRLASVSVIAETCALADGLATALFVMGAEEGMDWVEANSDTEAFFVISKDDRFEQVWSSRFFEGMMAE